MASVGPSAWWSLDHPDHRVAPPVGKTNSCFSNQWITIASKCTSLYFLLLLNEYRAHTHSRKNVSWVSTTASWWSAASSSSWPTRRRSTTARLAACWLRSGTWWCRRPASIWHHVWLLEDGKIHAHMLVFTERASTLLVKKADVVKSKKRRKRIRR